MKNIALLSLLLPFLFAACNQDEDLPATDFVMVKFVNQTGKDIHDLRISQVDIGLLKGGKTSDYFQYDALGEQYGYALVEAVGDIEGTRYYTASACQGVCGTETAPDGEWLEPGYYKVAVRISDELGGNYMEFGLVD